MSTGVMGPGVDVHQLASVIRNRVENVLVIDSRSFIEHNACHISSAVNVCCSKIVKRRLQQDKLSVKELLVHTCHCEIDEKFDVVVYDQSSRDSENLPVESFTVILLKKLQLAFHSVNLLKGGFDEFQKYYSDLCEDKTKKCAPLTSLSQPCLPIANQGPTRILPFLYLGSQFDAMNKDLLKDYNITYELNVSTACPQPEFVPEGHFMRIPVNDTYSEKLLPYFPDAFNFLDKVREGSGCVLVHCLAGISRSPTVAIAYVMRYLRLSSDDGYRYVKSKRPTISPNFNFLGQLLEYEKQLRRDNILEVKPEVTSAPVLCSKKRVCRTDMRTSKLSLDIDLQKSEVPNIFLQPRSGDQSPTTALAKLSFDVQQNPANAKNSQPTVPDFRQYRSKSCYGDWLRNSDDAERKARDTNIATPSKVLSPVKEIKCDGLISEISTGVSERNLKSVGTIRQRMRSSYHGGEGKQPDSFSHFSVEKYGTVCSTAAEEKFSLQTLTHHQTFASNVKVFEYSQGQEQQMVKQRSSSPLKIYENKSFLVNCEKKKGLESIQSETSKKRICQVPMERSSELVLNKHKTEPQFVFRESSISPKSSLLHPFSFNIQSYKRSNSSGTSGFGSESSDCTERNPESCRVDIDIDLEDDVIAKTNKDSMAKNVSSTTNRSFFPLSLPEVSKSQWPSNLRSPLSPSESHLLEDLEMDKDVCKTDPPSPSGSSFSYGDADSFHDSGVPISPLWPRKRVANFDTTCLNIRNDPLTRDKRKYKPFSESVPCNQRRVRTFTFPESASHSPVKLQSSTSGKNAYQFYDIGDKAGLYRVQSCPGILSYVSSFSALVDQPKKCSTKKCFSKSLSSDSQEMITHESCPDVLHLEDIQRSTEMQSYRQREFRRNVRCIQVS